MTADAWRSRILRLEDVDPGAIIPHPHNWRRHGAQQRAALRESLTATGWIEPVIVNQRTGHLVDGHLRAEEALAAELPTIPVAYVDLSEEEERTALLVLDPIAALADGDQQAALALANFEHAGTNFAGLEAVIKSTFADLLAEPPLDWSDVDPAGLTYTKTCPNCGYSW